jgi:hypothetical protein
MAVNDLRKRLGFDISTVNSTAAITRNLERPAVRVEGVLTGGGSGSRPFDRAVVDVESGLVAFYHNLDNASRRKAGESILPMSSASLRADFYLGIFFPGSELSFQGIKRFLISNSHSIYYEVLFGYPPGEIRFLQPVVKMLLDASTLRLYRYELAADHLQVGPFTRARIGKKTAEKIAAVNLGRNAIDAPFLEEGGEVSSVPTELVYVRPNDWMGLGGGVRRSGVWLAWAVPFGRAIIYGEESVRLVFVGAVTGKLIGGVETVP